MSQNTESNKRIASIDILRGFDMLLIIFADRFFFSLHKGVNTKVTAFLADQFDHPDWLGSTFYDIIMPLFLFIVGAVIPFSMEKRIQDTSKTKSIYKKLFKRFIVLFILGWIVQGNLLGLNTSEIYIFNNTLQAIAVGYLFSVMFYIHLSKKGRYIAFATCIILYMVLLEFAYVPDIGAGVLLPEKNFAIYIDNLILGDLHDGTQYTWILSGLGFTATTLSGLFAGEIIKSNLPRKRIAIRLFFYGLIGIILGLALGELHPIIKKIWTSSFILFSSGICFVFMALFYWIVDVKAKHTWAFPLKVIGMNAITAYVLSHVFSFPEISNYILFGLVRYSGDYHDMILSVGGFGILYLVLWYMYKKGTFVKV